MNMHIKKTPGAPLALETLGFAVLFIVFCFVFMIVKLPKEQIKERILHEVETGSRGKAEIVSLSLHPILSFKIAGVGYMVRNLAGEEVPVTIHNVRGSLSLFSLLLGKTVVNARGEMKGGSVKLTARSREPSERWSIELHGSEIPLQNFNVLLEPISLTGALLLNCTIDLEQNAVSDGHIEVQADDVLIHNFSYNGFELPDIMLSQVELLADIKADKVTIKTLSLEGPDLDIQVDGTIDLKRPIERSSLDLDTRIMVTPESLKRLNLSLLTGFIVVQQGKPIEIPIKGTIAAPKPDLSSILAAPKKRQHSTRRAKTTF